MANQKAISNLLLYCCLFSKTLAFNVDTTIPIILESPSTEGDNFGQSIEIISDTAVVGAPLSETHGNIFQCAFDPYNDNAPQEVGCNKIQVPSAMRNKQFKNLFGVTVAKKEKQIVSCAPRELDQTSFYTRYNNDMGKYVQIASIL